MEDQSTLRDLLQKQITHLNIDIENERKSEENVKGSEALKLILLESKRLTHLNICRLFPYRGTSICVFEFSYGFVWSSSLTELKINVSTFADCLCILDGRLPHLSKLIINVEEYSSRCPLSYMINVRSIASSSIKISYFIP